MVIVIGANNLGGIRELLTEKYGDVIHYKGYKSRDNELAINAMRDADLVVILTDYVCHKIAATVKTKAKNLGIPFIACKRSAVVIKYLL